MNHQSSSVALVPGMTPSFERRPVCAAYRDRRSYREGVALARSELTGRRGWQQRGRQQAATDALVDRVVDQIYLVLHDRAGYPPRLVIDSTGRSSVLKRTGDGTWRGIAVGGVQETSAHYPVVELSLVREEYSSLARLLALRSSLVVSRNDVPVKLYASRTMRSQAQVLRQLARQLDSCAKPD